MNGARESDPEREKCLFRNFVLNVLKYYHVWETHNFAKHVPGSEE